jgi:D-methionine transport system ATP-binding protein
MIQLQNLSKTFNTSNGQLVAVDDVTMTVDQGEIFGIIGYSGAGKSTLIRLLNGLEKPTSGSVTVNGQEISSSSGQALRSA